MPPVLESRPLVRSNLSHAQRTALLAGLALAAALVALCIKPIPQPEAYHHFHDDRAWLGIPNFFNVVSNLPFLIVGCLGLAWLRTAPTGMSPRLTRAYGVTFAGLAATALGSAWYHWAPTTPTLFWDRLPIAVSFMGLYAAILTERVSNRAGALLWPLVLFGAASALYWHVTDDLRPYLLAQFFPVLTIPLILWLFPARYGRGRDLMIGVGFYVAAKLFEDLDGRIYALGGLVSGHTLKHLAAAAGAYWIYRMLRLREPI